MTQSVRDQNRVSSLIGVSSLDLETPTLVAVNPTTGALMLDGTSLYANLDTRYLQISNNLSDIANASIARTNLGLVAGGAGDIWVEKAGDVMIGTNSTTFFQIQQADTTPVFNVDTTNARVGIRTATPAAALDVRGNIVAASDSSVLIASGGAIIANAGTDDYLVLAGKGTGGLALNYGSGTDGVRFYAGNTTEVAKIDSSGNIQADGYLHIDGAADSYIQGNVGIGETTPVAQLHVQTSGAAVIGQIIKGYASQSANLTEWRNSAGTVVALVDEAGHAVFGMATLTAGRALEARIDSDGATNVAGATNVWAMSSDADAFPKMGYQGGVVVSGAGNLTRAFGTVAPNTGVLSYNSILSASNVTGFFGVYSSLVFTGVGATGTIADYAAFSAVNPVNSLGGNGTITRSYGFYLPNWTFGATNYAIYTNAGLIRIGDDLFFEGDGSGFLFAEIYVQNAADEITITTAGQANRVQVTSFGVNGVSNGATPDHTNNHITIVRAGMYLVTVSLHIESAAAGGADTFGLSVYKNNGNTEFPNVHGHRKLAGGGGDVGSLSLSGIIDLAVDDTIELWVWNEDSTDNIVIQDVTLSLVMVGGT